MPYINCGLRIADCGICFRNFTLQSFVKLRFPFDYQNFDYKKETHVEQTCAANNNFLKTDFFV